MMDDDVPNIPQRLADDLAAVYHVPVGVPARINDAILNRARAQLARSRRWRIVRWTGSVAVAACAIFAMRIALRGPISPQDIDGNRRVDIVDALVLAQQIDAGKGRDMNGDGVVDQRDVDAIAYAAVQLDGGVQ